MDAPEMPIGVVDRGLHLQSAWRSVARESPPPMPNPLRARRSAPAPRPRSLPASAPATVTKALFRAAILLGLQQREVAAIIGVSAATVSRLANAAGELELDGKPGQLTLLLLRVYRSLDAVVGGDAGELRAWFHADNRHLGGVPAELVLRPEGLARVAEYLDAIRGKL
jgi:transcriptional regulator with XRE-family HTH domain